MLGHEGKLEVVTNTYRTGARIKKLRNRETCLCGRIKLANNCTGRCEYADKPWGYI